MSTIRRVQYGFQAHVNAIIEKPGPQMGSMYTFCYARATEDLYKEERNLPTEREIPADKNSGERRQLDIPHFLVCWILQVFRIFSFLFSWIIEQKENNWILQRLLKLISNWYVSLYDIATSIIIKFNYLVIDIKSII